MPDSKDARGWICELLDMDDEKLLAELERLLLDSTNAIRESMMSWRR